MGGEGWELIEADSEKKKEERERDFFVGLCRQNFQLSLKGSRRGEEISCPKVCMRLR